MFNGLANLWKFQRWKRDQSCSKDPYFLCCKTLRNGLRLRQDLYLSMRKLSKLSPISNLSHGVFFSVDLFFRRRRPMNITGAVAGNPRFRYRKTALSESVSSTSLQIIIVRSYRAPMFFLHVDTFKACAMAAPRSWAVKKSNRAYLNLWFR